MSSRFDAPMVEADKQVSAVAWAESKARLRQEEIAARFKRPEIVAFYDRHGLPLPGRDAPLPMW